MPPPKSEHYLLAWIGRTDLKAASGESEAGVGPIAQAVLAESYKAIHLLSDFSAADSEAYVKWLGGRSDAEIEIHPSKLSSPTNFGEIYEAATNVLGKLQGHQQLTFHLSPGTPAMAAVWILLAKTTWPAHLIQSSAQAGVHEADVPFDTNRAILRNLMENGIKDATGAHPGKSIIFARNHNHAVLLQELFDDMYPQYGGEFCRVIDNYDPRAEQLIDDFKDAKHALTIAISVDMLDTGIDVPEVVNLVFAKPVKSYVKFWQMIGRGTRLCPNLFGPCQDKTKFSIFDHWGNFAYFEESYREANPSANKALLQKLFEARLQLADGALAAANPGAFDLATKLMQADISALPETTIAVREKWREVREIQRPGVLQALSAITRSSLLKDIAPLMQWRDTRNWEDAYQLDLLIARMQLELLKKSAVFNDLRDELNGLVAQLPINVNAVRDKQETIENVRRGDFWKAVADHSDIAALESVREELRGIMRHRVVGTTGGSKPRVLDITEDASKIEFARHIPKLEGTELVNYRQRVEQVLSGLFAAQAQRLIDSVALYQALGGGIS